MRGAALALAALLALLPARALASAYYYNVDCASGTVAVPVSAWTSNSDVYASHVPGQGTLIGWIQNNVTRYNVTVGNATVIQTKTTRAIWVAYRENDTQAFGSHTLMASLSDYNSSAPAPVDSLVGLSLKNSTLGLALFSNPNTSVVSAAPWVNGTVGTISTVFELHTNPQNQSVLVLTTHIYSVPDGWVASVIDAYGGVTVLRSDDTASDFAPLALDSTNPAKIPVRDFSSLNSAYFGGAVDPAGLLLLAIWSPNSNITVATRTPGGALAAATDIAPHQIPALFTVVSFGVNEFAIFVQNRNDDSHAFTTVNAGQSWVNVDIGSRFIPVNALFTGRYFVTFTGFLSESTGYTSAVCIETALPFYNFSTLHPYRPGVTSYSPSAIIFAENFYSGCLEDVDVAVTDSESYTMFIVTQVGSIVETTCDVAPLPVQTITMNVPDPLASGTVDFAIGLAVGVTSLIVASVFLALRKRVKTRQDQIQARRDSSVSDDMASV